MRKIIVVDDEPITRMDICEILREANYDVVAEAGDGFDAIEQSKKYNPDFVIMDVKMPILDGLKAAKVIREQKLSRGIVLLTAYSNKEFIEEAKNIGIIGYIVKPIDEKSFICVCGFVVVLFGGVFFFVCGCFCFTGEKIFENKSKAGG